MKTNLLKSSEEALKNRGGYFAARGLDYCRAIFAKFNYQITQGFLNHLNRYAATVLLLLCLGVGNVWGTVPADTYYSFTEIKGQNATISPTSGVSANKITTGSNSAAGVASIDDVSFMDQSYSYALKMNNSTAKSFSIDVSATTENPAHIILFCSGSGKTIQLFNSDETVVLDTAFCYNVPTIVDLKTTATGTHKLYASGSVLCYHLKVLYEGNNNVFTRAKSGASLSLPSNIKASSDTICFFKPCEVPVSEGKFKYGGSNTNIRKTIHFTSHVTGTLTVNVTNSSTSDGRTAAVYEQVAYNTLGTALATSSSMKKKESATIEVSVTKGKRYAIRSSSSDVVITSLTLAPSCSDETGLAYGTGTVNKTYGDASFTNTLTNSNSLSVTYSSDDTDVATVNESTGAVTIVGAGSTTIRASWAGNSTYCEDEVSYTLNVKPAVGSVTGRWDRFGGETISLSVSPSGGSSYTYQWKKWYNDQWNNVTNGTSEGVTISGATTSNLQISNCVLGNSGSYSCVVTSGGQSNQTDGRQVKVYVLECYNGGTTVHNFTRTGDSQAGTLTIDLSASTAYTFKVHADNDYFGNNASINEDITNYVFCNSNNGGNCASNFTINSGLGGTFTIGIDYSTGGNSNVEGEPEISVTYPRKTIYLSPGVWTADDAKFAYYYFRDGGSAAWTDFLTSDDCGMYADIPQWNGVKVIAGRINGALDAPAFGDGKCWNQTGNLTVTSNDYIVVNSWDDITYNSTYSTPTYTISYNKGSTTYTGGNTISGSKDSETKTCGVDFTLPSSAVFTTTGYTQTGWATSDGGSSAYDLGDDYTTNSAQTFYPAWTVQSFTLTWDLAGGTVTTAGTGAAVDATGTPSSSVNYGTAITKPTVTKTGYDFAGWDVTPAGTMPAANTTYTATWTAKEYTITYKDKDNETFSGAYVAEKPTTHTYGTGTTLVKAVKAGYEFGGWYTKSDCSEGLVTSLGATDYTDNIKLYAKWTAMEMVALANNTLYTAQDMAPEGLTIGASNYYCPGVSSDQRFNSLGAGNSNNATGACTFTNNNNTISGESFTTAVYFKQPASGTRGTALGSTLPTNHAIQFKISGAGKLDIFCKEPQCIYLVKDGSSAEVLDGSSSGAQKITKSVTAGTYYIYSINNSTNDYDDRIYGLRFRQNYTITYNTDGASEDQIANGTKTHGDNFTLSSSRYTKDGYWQTGWATSQGGSQVYAFGATYTGNANLTLYPAWTPKAEYEPDLTTSAKLSEVISDSRWTLTTGDDVVSDPTTVGGDAATYLTGSKYGLAFAKSYSASATYDLGAQTKVYQITITMVGEKNNTSTVAQLLKSNGTFAVDEEHSELSIEWPGSGDEWQLKTFTFTFPEGQNYVQKIKIFGSSYHIGIRSIKVEYAPTQTLVKLDNQSATSAGTTSVTATWHASTNLTSSITPPTKTGYTFGGYYTGTSGSGTQLIDENGAWIASKTNYTDGSKNWQYPNADLTLYAKWTCTSPTFGTNLSTSEVDYDKNASATALTVAATANSGTVTYQWYSNTANSTSSPTPTEIVGATSASYTPPTSSVGTTYYFCTATNTTGSCSANSNIAKIVVENCSSINASITFDNNKSAKYDTSWEDADVSTSGGASWGKNSIGSDTGHPMTKPAMKLDGDGDSIKFELPAGITSGRITIKACTYLGKTGTLLIRKGGVNLSSTEVGLVGETQTYKVNSPDGESWTDPTLKTVTYDISSGGVYSIKRTGNSVYIYAFSVTGVKECPGGHDVNIASLTNGSISADPESADEDEEVTLTVTPDTGYELSSITVTGDDSDDEVETTGSGDGPYTFTMPDEAVTVDATFTLKTYTVSFAVSPAGYGSVDESSIASVNHGSTVSISTNKLTLSGTTVTATAADQTDQYTYAFSGWSVSNGASITSAQTITANFTRTARTYTVTLNKNGGECDNVTSYTYGTGATLPTDVTRSGYLFQGWYDNSSFTGSAVTTIANDATGDKEYWAKWYELEDICETMDDEFAVAVWNDGVVNSITYDLEGIDAEDGITFGYNGENENWNYFTLDIGDLGTLKEIDLTVASVSSANVGIDYLFGGDYWDYNDDRSKADGFKNGLSADEVIPLYPSSDETTFVFSAYSGSSTSDNIKISNICIYYLPETHELTWNTNGGSDLSCTGTCTSGTMAVGTTIVAPSNPTKDNYTFMGWKTNNDGTGTSPIAAMSTSDLTYYAAWQQMVTLKTGAAGVGADKTPTVYLNGASLSGFSAHTASGYTLQGYYTDASGGTKVLNADGSFAATNVTDYITSSKWSRTGSTTLYAQWSAIEYTITYTLHDGGAGSVSGNTTYTIADDDYDLPTPTWSGHVFQGWYDNSSYTGDRIYVLEGGSTGNKTFHAKWGTEVSVVWDIDAVDDKLYKGGGGHTVTAIVDDASWDASGDKDDLLLSASEGVILGEQTTGVYADGTYSGKAYVTAEFAISGDVDGDAITFTLTAPAAGSYGAIEDDEEVDLDACPTGGDLNVYYSYSISSTSAVTNASTTGGTFTSYNNGSTLGSASGFYTLKDNSITKAYFIINTTNAIAVGDRISVTTNNTEFDLYTSDNVEVADNVTTYYTVVKGDGICGTHSFKIGRHDSGSQFNTFTVTSVTPDGVAASLTWDDGALDIASEGVAKEVGDPDFTFTASADNNSIGAVTYSSSAPSVATVNATTGKVHIVGTGDATITATLADCGCYNGNTATYDITVTSSCSDVAGTVTATDLGCRGVELTVSGYTDGATIAWYKDGAAITPAATGTTYTTKATGEYYAVTTSSCSMASNSITVDEIVSSTISPTIFADEFTVKDYRPFEYRLLQLAEGESWSATASSWNENDYMITKDADNILTIVGNAHILSAGTETITITITNECDESEEVDITIHKVRATDHPQIAWIATGTKGDKTSVLADESTNTALYKALVATGEYDLTPRNCYWSVSEADLIKEYSQYDLVILTDYPNSQTGPDGKGRSKSYTNALGLLIDHVPMLTFEAFVSGCPNWGFESNPTNTKSTQNSLTLLCNANDIFGTSDTYNAGADIKVGDDIASGQALQGFALDAMPNYVFIAKITDSDDKEYVTCCERQENMNARMMVFGLNASVMDNITATGKNMVIGFVDYLLKDENASIPDCSVIFNGTTNSNWSTTTNWEGISLPNPYASVRIDKPCVVADNDVAKAGYIKIHVSTSDDTYTGSLTISPQAAMIVENRIYRVEDNDYTDYLPTEPGDLVVEADDEHTGALIFNNDNGRTKATVEMYSKSYWETVDGKKKKYWSYIGIPIQSADIPEYFYNAFTYLYDETSGWIKKGNGTTLHAFEGIGLSRDAAGKETFTGALASTKTRNVTLSYTAGKGAGMNLIGNSWTAPIQIANFDADDFGDATATVYVYNTGRDKENEGDAVGGTTSTTAGQWVAVPIATAKTGGYTGLKVIPAMNAFEVNTSSRTILTLDYDKLVRGVETNLNKPMRAPRRDREQIELEAIMCVRVNGEKTYTDVWLQQDERFTNAFDNGWEATYSECDNRSAQFYAQSELGKMAFLAKPDIEGTVLGFAPSRDGNDYTFTFHYIGDEYFYLNDLKLQQSVLIDAENTYSFTYAEGDTNRFYISRTPLGMPQTPTGVDGVVGDQPSVVRKLLINDHIYIIRDGRVYSIDGALVK